MRREESGAIVGVIVVVGGVGQVGQVERVVQDVILNNGGDEARIQLRFVVAGGHVLRRAEAGESLVVGG